MKEIIFLFNVIIVFMLNIFIFASPSEAAWPIIKNDWTNKTAKLKYKQVAIKICDSFNPEYLALAIEANTYYLKHPKDFEHFITLYKDIYDTIKTNPNYSRTKVFVTFQLENMKGLGTAVGLPGKPQWEILNMFDGKLDLLAFTSYPEVEYSTPEEMPADYYSDIYNNIPANLQDKKIAFSGIGWNSENLIPVTGGKNSYRTQVYFIDRFAHLINSLKDSGKIEFVAWTMMHDLKDTDDFHPMRTVGLRNSLGKPKDVNDSVWKMWHSFYQFQSPAFKVGIGPIPPNFPGSYATDWLDMYKKVPTIASLILAQTDWYDYPKKAGEIPRFFNDLKSAKFFHQVDCIYSINFFNQVNGEAKIFTEKKIIQPFVIAVVIFIFLTAGIIICKITNCFSYTGKVTLNLSKVLFQQKSGIAKSFTLKGIGPKSKEEYFLEKGLSFREQEVLEYLIQGKSYKEIADKLKISIETVKKHASSIYQKTNTTGKSELRHDILNNLN